MLWIMVRKELLANLLSFRFILIFLLCFTLILVSAYTMRGKYSKLVEEYSDAMNVHRQELTEAEKNQRVPSMSRLAKPPTPLSVVAEGMEGATGRFAVIGILSPPRLEGGSGSDPMFAHFGTLDMMYIVRVVLSLVAILLTYDAISGEREQGTLKLALSNSVPRHIVLLSKCIGGYITLLFPFLVPALIGLLILTTSGDISFSGEEWIRLGLIFLVSLLYIGFFLMLGLLVSSRSGRSSTSLMLLLFMWVVIVLAVPKVSMIIADRVSEVPSYRSVQADLDAVDGQLWGEFRKRREELKEQYKNDALKRRDVAIRMQGETGIAVARKRWEIQSEYDRKKAAQFRLAANISRISPASVYTYATTGLARAGFDRQERFLAAARSYQIALAYDYYNAIWNIAGGKKLDLGKLMAPEFRESSLSESWNSVWGDSLILVLLMVCFFMIAYVGFVRSDVR